MRIEKGCEVDKWRALVAAEQEVARCRAEVNQLPSRVELLAKAISGNSAWDRSTALTFLCLFPEDVSELLEVLVDLSMSPGWAQPSSEAIRAARRELDPSRLAEMVVGHLAGGDADDYLRLADMLTRVEAWETLGIVIQEAFQSSDPEIQEVAHDFNESYGGMLP